MEVAMLKSGSFSSTRYILITSAVALFASQAFSQPMGRPVRVLPQPGAVFLPRSIATIYSSSGFAGQAEELGVGEHRVSGASSIRVAPGTVAVLYQFSDDAGGYGVSVDLLEDQPDLAGIGLDHVSFVTVFAATRDNFHWARGALRDGQYIPGHWERNRAAGNPVNPVAVASPPLPARGATIATAVEHQGSVWTITHLGTQSSADAGAWVLADQQMGVIGSDYRGPQRIGDAAFERASNNTFIPDWINFWYPNPPSLPPNDHRGRSKRTLVGNILDKVTKNWTGTVLERGPNGQLTPRVISGEYELSSPPGISDIHGTYEDFDLNVDVLPYAAYDYLIKESHKPERSTIKYMKDLVDSDHDPCTDPFIKVEAEIDSSDTAKQKLLTALRARIGKPIAFYGPWIYDVGHCDHPEIHPAEQIWWTDTAFTDYAGTVKRYNLNVIADSSKRFWWRHQMDGSNKMHPWGAPPITGLFAVAFEVPLNQVSTLQSGKQYKVQDVDFYNVKILEDNSRSFDLKYNGATLVSFVPGSPAFTVSYERIGLKPGSSDIVRGFLVIETTVGSVRQKSTRGVIFNGGTPVYINVPEGADPDTVDARIESQIFEKTAGHYLFRLIETPLLNRPPTMEPTR
jgi:hypothetical protein